MRLHQPSAFYGVDSVPLGNDKIDFGGMNAGFYESATADELRAYFANVMQEHFLPTGRVRFFPCSDYVGGEGDRHHFVSRLTGAMQEVRVKRKVVDTTYLEGQIPATSLPPFEVDKDAHCIPAGDVTRLAVRVGQFVVIGAGKTALDTCVWLLTNGVPPSSICWLKSCESCWLNRRLHWPCFGLPEFYRGTALQFQAMSQATSVEDLFLRLEADGFFMRVDQKIMPTMMRGAILSEFELALLRQLKDVVRLGRVRRIGRGRVVLGKGEIATADDAIYIHCAAHGLARPPLRTIFGAGRLTVQPTMWGFASQQFALLGVVEALIVDNDEKNRLCPTIRYWDCNADYLTAYMARIAGEQARNAYPSLAAWTRASRLKALGRLGENRDHPSVVAAGNVLKAVGAAAIENVSKLVAERN